MPVDTQNAPGSHTALHKVFLQDVFRKSFSMNPVTSGNEANFCSKSLYDSPVTVIPSLELSLSEIRSKPFDVVNE